MRIAHKPQVNRAVLSSLAQSLIAKKVPASNTQIKEVADIALGAEPLILETSDAACVYAPP